MRQVSEDYGGPATSLLCQSWILSTFVAHQPLTHQRKSLATLTIPGIDLTTQPVLWSTLEKPGALAPAIRYVPTPLP